VSQISGARAILAGRMIEDPRETHIATVKAVYAAFTCGDVDAALAHVAHDCEMRPEGTSRLTGRAVYRGHDGIREYFADAARVWERGLTIEPVDYRAVAGSVVVFGRVFGVTPEGPLEAEVVWVWKLRDGLLTSGQVFSTKAAALEAAVAAG
jgi:ketosteroid isomerase-like protein